MTIEISNESGIAVDETVLLRLMEYNLAELHVSPDADVAILLVDEGAMEALTRALAILHEEANNA